MKQELKDYAKSVIANKYTLIGYLGMSVVGGIEFYLETKSFPIKIFNLITFGSSFTSALGSNFAKDTYKIYQNTKKHIEEKKTIEPEFKNKYSKYYDYRVGMKLAAKESGLEDLV